MFNGDEQDPHRVGIQEALDVVLDASPTDPGFVLAAAIQAGRTVTKAVDGALVGLLPSFEASGEWAQDGSQGTIGWLMTHTAMSRGEATIYKSTARTVAQVPALAKAAEAGLLPLSHFRLLSLARRKPVVEVFDRDAAALVEAARTMHADALKGHVQAWYWDALAELEENDPDGPPPPPEADRITIQGVCSGRADVTGELGPEALAIIGGAIDAEIDTWHRNGVMDGDTRTRPELNAAAMTEICRRYLHPGTLGGEPRPSLVAIADLDTLLGRAGVAAEDRFARRAEIIGGGPVADRTVQRLLCDAKLRFCLTDTLTGEPLYLGRTRRTASAGQRAALHTRNRQGGCEARGCTAPHLRRHAHHIKEWDPLKDEGDTDIDNLVLLCPFHHHLVHEGRFSLQRDPTGPGYLLRNPAGHLINAPPYTG
jgi:hypothetical protein